MRYDVLAVSVTSLAVILSQYYVFEVPAYDFTSFLAGVAFPTLFGFLIFLAIRRRILLFAFLAYIWSIVDDAPVYFDSVLTWPEVTRFHPAEPHIFLEVLLHILTGVFLYLTIRESLKGTYISNIKILKVFILTSTAFVLSYAQNIPLSIFQTFVETGWYQLDAIEHVASIMFLILAVREAAKTKIGQVLPHATSPAAQQRSTPNDQNQDL